MPFTRCAVSLQLLAGLLVLCLLSGCAQESGYSDTHAPAFALAASGAMLSKVSLVGQEGGADTVPAPDAGSTFDAGPGCNDLWCMPADSGTGEEEVVTQNFGARGLYTSPSFLTAAPKGAATLADNLVIDVPGEYTTRRGFQRLPAALPGGVPVQAWTVYRGVLVAHSGATLYRYSAGAWTAYPGTYFPPTVTGSDGEELTVALRFFETQQALYFTTSDGVYRLESPTGTPTPAGVSQALPGVASVSAAGQALSVSSATAYRYVWGRRAENGRVHLGAPSGRVVVTNRSEAVTFSPSAMSRSSGVVTLTVTAGVASNLLVGQVITLTASSNAALFPTGSFPITNIVGTLVYYAQAGADGSAASPGGMSFTSVGTGVSIAHTVPFPEGVDDTYFLQVYRADEVPTNTDPSDEMYLIHERAVADMSTGFWVSGMFRVSNVVTVNVGNPHNLQVGDMVELMDQFTIPSDATNFPPGVKTVASIIDDVRFTYAETGPDANLAGSAFFEFADSYSFVDNTPDDLKADALYTNANSGGSSGTANYPPPKAVETGLFRNRAVYANVELPERITLSVLAVGPGGLDVDSGIEFTDGSQTETYYGGTSEGGMTFKVFTDGSPSQNIANTVRSLVSVINNKTGGLAYARYVSTSDSINPGQFVIESRSEAALPLTVRALQNSPFIVPALTYRAAAADLVRSGNVTTVTTFLGFPHGFVVGQVVRGDAGDFPDPAFPSGTFTVASVVSPNVFTINDPGPNAPIPPDTAPAGYMFYTTGPEVQTDDEAAPGGWMISPVDNPDAVRATIPEIAGDRYKRILKVMPMGESVFFLKEDGLHRLTGEDETSFAVECVDSTIRFVAPRASWVMNGRAYALTTQGLSTWTENGTPEPAALQIESDLRRVVETAPDAVELHAFAVPHESKRRAYLWLPSVNEDMFATQAYVYNATADGWTRWPKYAVEALVHPVEDRLYLAPPEADGTGIAPAPAFERNTGTNADYADEGGEPVMATLEWTPQFAPDGNSMSQLVRATYHFAGTAPHQLDVQFGTDIGGWGPYFVIDATSSQSPGTFQTPPTLEQSRGRYHMLRVRHFWPGEPLRILGVSLQQRYHPSTAW